MLLHIHQLHIQNADWIQNHTTNAVRHTLTIPYIAPNPIVWILLSFSLCLSLSYTEGLSLSLFIRLQFSLYLAASVLRSLSNLPHSCCSPFLLSPHTGAVTRSWHPILIACHRRKFSSRTTYRVKIFKRLMQSCCCSRLLKVLLFKLRLIVIDKKFEEIFEEGQIGNFKVWRHK